MIAIQTTAAMSTSSSAGGFCQCSVPVHVSRSWRPPPGPGGKSSLGGIYTYVESNPSTGAHMGV